MKYLNIATVAGATLLATTFSAMAEEITVKRIGDLPDIIGDAFIKLSSGVFDVKIKGKGRDGADSNCIYIANRVGGESATGGFSCDKLSLATTFGMSGKDIKVKRIGDLPDEIGDAFVKLSSGAFLLKFKGKKSDGSDLKCLYIANRAGGQSATGGFACDWKVTTP